MSREQVICRQQYLWDLLSLSGAWIIRTTLMPSREGMRDDGRSSFSGFVGRRHGR